MSKCIQLGNRIVGDGQRPYFIAEIGINHNGDLLKDDRYQSELKLSLEL